MIALLLAAWLACGPAAPTAPEPVRYTVVKGDTLGKIAKAHGVSVDELRAWNHLSGDTIEVGQVIEIHTAAPVAATPRRRKGRAGDAPVAVGGDDLPPRPAPKACLSGPSGDDLGEAGAAASQGLDGDDVRAAMRGFVGHTLRCFAADAPSGTVGTELVVGCDGVVRSVEITNDGGFDAATVACVRDVLGRTPFPAHDLPDGDRFAYPLVYTAPE